MVSGIFFFTPLKVRCQVTTGLLCLLLGQVPGDCRHFIFYPLIDHIDRGSGNYRHFLFLPPSRSGYQASTGIFFCTPLIDQVSGNPQSFLLHLYMSGIMQLKTDVFQTFSLFYPFIGQIAGDYRHFLFHSCRDQISGDFTHILFYLLVGQISGTSRHFIFLPLIY